MKLTRDVRSALELVLWWALMLAGALSLASWLVTVPWPARAQADGHAQHHDWYLHLKTPSGHSCCDNRDCRPVQARPRDDGGWEAYFGGRWQSISPERILPDHLNRVPLHAHICEQDGYVRCFLKGGGGT